VSIARALYADADVVLLDCALSAVDAAVGRHIFQSAIVGAMAGKTRLMATNQLHHAAAAAVDYVAVVAERGVVEFAPRTELLADPDSRFATLLREQGLTPEADHEPGGGGGGGGGGNGGASANGRDGPPPSGAAAPTGAAHGGGDGVSNGNGDGVGGKADSAKAAGAASEEAALLGGAKGAAAGYGAVATGGTKAATPTDAAAAPSGRLTEDESRTFGRVRVGNYTLYLKAIGGVPVVAAIVACAVAAQALSIFLNFWLSLWSDASEVGGTAANSKYLFVYVMLGVASVVVAATATTVLALAGVRASRVIHRRLLLSVLKAVRWQGRRFMWECLCASVCSAAASFGILWTRWRLARVWSLTLLFRLVSDPPHVFLVAALMCGAFHCLCRFLSCRVLPRLSR